MHSGGTWRLGHRPALDGLRGVAVLLVLACHALDPFNPGALHALGAAGVTVFFTLSGFLITSLLLEERDRGGRVSLAAFYARRALRLFPALAAAVVGLMLLSWWLTNFVPNPWPTLLYVANWTQARGGTLPYFGPTWSLSIEEQFYLLWPLALIAAVRWRHGVLMLAAGGIVASTVLRFVLYDSGEGSLRVYYGADTQASTLLVGCLLAALARRGLRPATAQWVAPVGIVVLGALAFVRAYSVGDVWVPTLVPMLAAAMIWTSCHHPGVLGSTLLRYVGRRSYAIYLWHSGLLWLASVPAGPSAVSVTAGLAMTLIVAELSWRCIESPFLRFKKPRRSADPGDATQAVDGDDEFVGGRVLAHAEAHKGGRE